MSARRLRLCGLAGVAIMAAPAFVSVGDDDADARKRRTVLPPPNVRLWSSMAVNLTEWSVRPGHLHFKAGDVRLHVYNLGMDDHDLTIADASGRIVATRAVVAKVGSKAGEAVFTAHLPRGRFKLYCSLFAGTADDHEKLGMVSYVRVY
jgi:hypothetical protein